MIIGSMFLMPWPISGFFDVIVTAPSAAMLTKAVATYASAAPPGGPCARTSTGSRCRATRRPPPAAALTFRKARRLRRVLVVTAPPYSAPAPCAVEVERDVPISAARLMAARIRVYVPHRQIFPVMAVVIWASEGLGVVARSAAADM